MPQTTCSNCNLPKRANRFGPVNSVGSGGNVSSQSGAANRHLVLTGFTKGGWLKEKFVRQSFKLTGLSEAAADQLIQQLKNGESVHPSLEWSAGVVGTKGNAQQTLEKTLGLASIWCSCSGPTTDKNGELDTASLEAQLAGPQRADALRSLLEAAQWSPAACDLLIKDALSRNDVIQADHWQSKKHALQNSTPSPTVKRKTTSATSTWMGISTDGGGDF